MIKVHYSLMAKGKQNKLRLINGQVVELEEPIDAVYYSSPAYVVGQDEETCLNKIRQKLKRMYIGFKVLKQENI